MLHVPDLGLRWPPASFTPGYGMARFQRATQKPEEKPGTLIPPHSHKSRSFLIHFPDTTDCTSNRAVTTSWIPICRRQNLAVAGSFTAAFTFEMPYLAGDTFRLHNPPAMTTNLNLQPFASFGAGSDAEDAGNTNLH